MIADTRKWCSKQRFKARLTTAIVLLLTPLLSFADDTPALYTAQYEGEYSGWDIKMVRTLTPLGNGHYRFKSEADNLFGSISEISEFQMDKGALSPSSYEYKSSVFGRKKLETLKFLPQKKEIIYEKNNKQRFVHEGIDSPWSDPALYQLELQQKFGQGDKEVTLDFVKRKKVKHYNFKRVGEDEVEVNDKVLQAIVVQRQEEGKSTKVWLVPEMDYVIAKLVHSDEGDTYSLALTEYHSDAPALAKFYNRLE